MVEGVDRRQELSASSSPRNLGPTHSRDAVRVLRFEASERPKDRAPLNGCDHVVDPVANRFRDLGLDVGSIRTGVTFGRSIYLVYYKCTVV
jgi:hypothetical protein